MSTRIIHKKSNATGVVPVISNDATNELELGEIAINTHDGKMFIRQDADGTISLKEIGKADSVENVLYVSKSGNNTNDGKTLGTAFASIKAALDSLAVLEAANAGSTAGTTIFVKSGTYVETNDTTVGNPMGGMVVPKNVSIVGDNLRTTRVAGTTPGNDLFYVQNASYITNLTFQGMNADGSKPRPPAAVSFPPISLQPGGVAQTISTSPYVENCTAFNQDATGMLIDGSLTTGLRSMVSDSFTQINAGGRGVHIINRGYAQLVSIFTVSCDYAILCESGGQCSLTNSNASFGNYGLKASGASESLYAGAMTSQAVAFDTDIEITTTTPPKYGDAFLINDKDNQLIAKCGRDVELILDSVGYDTALNTNFNSIYSGIAYKRANALPADQVTPTSDALFETKRLVGLLEDIAEISTLKSSIDGKFDIVTGIINNGATTATFPGDSFGTPTLSLPNTLNRHASYRYAASDTGGASNTLGALLANRAFIQEEINAFVLLPANNPPAGYDQDKCKRDVGYIVDALCYDLMYGGNSATLLAARSYFDGAVAQLPTAAQVTSTVNAYDHLADVVRDVITNTPITKSSGNPASQATNAQQATGGQTTSVSVSLEAHDLVIIIKDMIQDGDLEALPTLILPTFPASGDGVIGKNVIDDNKRELRQATTDWVIINTGIEDNFYYSVEGVEASVDFEITDYNGFLPLSIESADIDNSTQTIQNLQRQTKNTAGAIIDVPGITGHGLVQGQPVKYSCTGTPISGLTSGQVYFVIKVDGTDIKLSETQRNFYETGTDVVKTISNAGMSGTHTLTPGFYYNEDKCERDVGLIIDAVRDDMLLGTNFNSVYTGISYQRASAYTTVTNTDQKAPTLAAMLDVKRVLSQLSDVSASDKAYHRVRAAVDEIIHIFEDGTVSVTAPGDGVADKLFLPNTLNASAATVSAKDSLLSSSTSIQNDVITYVQSNFPSLTGYETKCRRDVGFIVDAIAYDILYGTNTASIRAAQSYFITTFDASGNESSVSQLAAGQSAATISAYQYMRDTLLPTAIGNSNFDTTIDTLMNIIINHIDTGAAVPAVDALVTTNIATDLITASTQINSQKSTIQTDVGSNVDIYRVIPLENVRDDFLPDQNGDLRFTVDFKKRSLIAASSMTFEYVGTGTEIQGLTSNTDDLYNRPRTDDFPKTQNEVIFDETTNLGAVYFTSTDHKGDFRIGSGMRINRTDGTIEGDTFNRSLFSVMTPYILAIEGN
jgi:hypothetical protein